MNSFNNGTTASNNSWIRSAISASNPVVGDIRRAIRGTPLGVPFLNQRQNSCPNQRGSLSDGAEPVSTNFHHTSAVAGTSNATVIEIESSDDVLGPTSGHRNRRRSSPGSPAVTTNSNLARLPPLNNSVTRGIVPELGNIAASMWLDSQRPEIQPASLIPSLPGAANIENHQESPRADRTEGRESEEDDPDDTNGHNSLPSLRSLLRNREALTQFFWQNFGEFPNLHGLNVLLTGALVVIMLIVQFLFHHFGSCFALVLGFVHYQDAARFVRCISGAGDIYFPFANIIIRNFIILHVLDKGFILQAVTFHDQISLLPNATFFAVVYRVISTELFIMDIALVFKLLICKLPWISKIYKRRVYQWIEYTSTLYRFVIPAVQWTAYFDGLGWAIIYCVVKMVIGLSIMWTWFRTTIRLFRYSHLGTMPSAEEINHAEHCTICYADFASPIKLNCGHVFCSDCIRTWLDREVTCPICRATVTKEDNNFRNGNSIFPMHIF